MNAFSGGFALGVAFTIVLASAFIAALVVASVTEEEADD
jgi:hypothetical protein